MLSCVAAQAQDIVGSWRTQLPIGVNPPRTVLKISKSADGVLRVTRYQVDKGNEGMPMTTVGFDAPKFTTRKQTRSSMRYSRLVLS